MWMVVQWPYPRNSAFQFQPWLHLPGHRNWPNYSTSRPACLFTASPACMLWLKNSVHPNTKEKPEDKPLQGAMVMVNQPHLFSQACSHTWWLCLPEVAVGPSFFPLCMPNAPHHHPSPGGSLFTWMSWYQATSWVELRGNHGLGIPAF